MVIDPSGEMQEVSGFGYQRDGCILWSYPLLFVRAPQSRIDACECQKRSFCLPAGVSRQICAFLSDTAS
jgi:hypothetical protein